MPRGSPARGAFFFLPDRIEDVRVILISALAALAVAIASAQNATSSKPVAETAHLTIVTLSSAANASAGDKLSLFVEITPKPEMHLYAPGEKDGIPVTLTIEPNPAIKASPPQFPQAEKFFFAPLKLTQLVFSRPFRITQPITLVGSPQADPLTIKGSLRYQACDDKVCYAPKTVPLVWTLPR
jgi:thiol:disulfide interchange protein DsbD